MQINALNVLQELVTFDFMKESQIKYYNEYSLHALFS